MHADRQATLERYHHGDMLLDEFEAVFRSVAFDPEALAYLASLDASDRAPAPALAAVNPEANEATPRIAGANADLPKPASVPATPAPSNMMRTPADSNLASVRSRFSDSVFLLGIIAVAIVMVALVLIVFLSEPLPAP